MRPITGRIVSFFKLDWSKLKYVPAEMQDISKMNDFDNHVRQQSCNGHHGQSGVEDVPEICCFTDCEVGGNENTQANPKR